MLSRVSPCAMLDAGSNAKTKTDRLLFVARTEGRAERRAAEFARESVKLFLLKDFVIDDLIPKLHQVAF